MYVTTIRAVASTRFLEEGSVNVRMRQLVGREDGARRTAMHEIILGKGALSAKHAHEWDHQLVVTSGRGVAVVQRKKVPLRPGVVLLVQSEEMHQFFQKGTAALTFLTVTPI
ncbi:MAG TPA: cupin domain-containing protein [Thermoplasmata archaeon]|nr:cupin domain-containing protein [Thermoplasmata archaeon]